MNFLQTVETLRKQGWPLGKAYAEAFRQARMDGIPDGVNVLGERPEFNAKELHALSNAPLRLRVPNRDLLRPSRQSAANWRGVHDGLAYWAGHMVRTLARDFEIPFRVFEARRTPQQQIEYHRRGVSKALPPRAAHVQGAAVDLIHEVFLWNLTQTEWQWVGALGKKIHERVQHRLPKHLRFEIEWGGDWRFFDPAHWEVVGWKDNVLDPPAPFEPPVTRTYQNLVRPQSFAPLLREV